MMKNGVKGRQEHEGESGCRHWGRNRAAGVGPVLRAPLPMWMPVGPKPDWFGLRGVHVWFRRSGVLISWFQTSQTLGLSFRLWAEFRGLMWTFSFSKTHFETKMKSAPYLSSSNRSTPISSLCIIQEYYHATIFSTPCYQRCHGNQANWSHIKMRIKHVFW
jgi:hypothetical protein